ncbi:MAG: helix-turn-helix transcriptional regulator, partial [Adlercreutzia sp.]|nr:helix-turn-helix transcriptional regulator [Adlercreutzia sp.]
MKLPHIKVEVEYREEDTGAPGKMSPALIAGFGLHWAWVYLFMFNGQFVLFPETGFLQTMLSTVSGIVHAAALLAYAVFLKQARLMFGTPQRIRNNRVVAAALMAVAVALCLLGNCAGSVPAAITCFVLAGVTSGVGSAALLMSFGVSFSVCDLPTIALCAALSVPVGALVFAAAIVVGAVVPLTAGAICFALPFLELACLNRCSADLVDKLEFSYLTMPVRTASFAGHIGVPSVVLGLLLGVLRTCALIDPISNPFLAEGGSTSVFSSAVFAASLLTCGALVLAMLTLRKTRNFAFRMLVPIIAVLLALLCSPWGADSFFHCFALFASYFMLEVCLWMMYSDIAQTYRVSAFTTFGFGHGLLSTGSLAGFLMLQPGGLLEGVAFNDLGLVIVGLVTLTLGVAVLPNAAEIRSTLIRGRRCPAVFEDINDLVGDAPVEVPRGLGEEAAAMEEPAAAEPQGGEEVRGAGDGNDRAAELLEAEGAPGCDGSASSTRTPDASPAFPEGFPATPETPTAEQQAQQLGRFKRKCAAVADTFLLSRKETEVLFLLAKGRNSAAIQESLYISAGTANTHMRHIYR